MNIAESAYAYFYRKRKREAESRRIKFDNIRIISVGNITIGGTGKTPCVQWLARRFQNENNKVAIVGRGYGGEYSAQGAIVCDGEKILLDAKQAGDEAVLHARHLKNVPIVIGRDRVAACKIAIENFAPDILILDDGFQYWSLGREFDLVLLDAKNPFSNRKLLPSGRLREPIEELQRADGVLLTRCDAASENEIARARNSIEALCDAPFFQSSHAPKWLRDEKSGARLELGVLSSKRVSALSALADDKSFFDSLSHLGAHVGSTLARRDHHAWREKEIREFAKRAEEQGATALVTTEKDAVKIDADWCADLPLWSLVIEMKIENEAALWDLIQSKIKR